MLDGRDGVRGGDIWGRLSYDEQTNEGLDLCGLETEAEHASKPGRRGQMGRLIHPTQIMEGALAQGPPPGASPLSPAAPKRRPSTDPLLTDPASLPPSPSFSTPPPHPWAPRYLLGRSTIRIFRPRGACTDVLSCTTTQL